MFVLVQAATALILYTGGNTSFNGFPFLASFVAEDAFLPRWLTKRGHRLVFSNGIIVLAVLSSRPARRRSGANVNNLVPFYAHRRVHRLHDGRVRHGQVPPPAPGSRGWRRKLVINFSAGRDLAGRRADLRGGQVHRGRLAGRDPVRGRRARPDLAEPAVRPGGHGPGDDRRPAAEGQVAARAADLLPAHRLRVRRRLRPGHARRRCATPAACGRPPCARSTSSSTTCRPTGCARTGSGPTPASSLDFVDCPDRRLAAAAAEMVERRGRAARRRRHRDPAAAQLRAR